MKYDTAPTAPLEFADWLEQVAEDEENTVAPSLRHRIYVYAAARTKASGSHMHIGPDVLMSYAERIRHRIPEIIAEKLTS